MDILLGIIIVLLAIYFIKNLVAVALIAAAVAFVVYILRNGQRPQG